VFPRCDRRATEPDGTQESILRDRGGTDNLRQAAEPDPPLKLHLPQPVLRVHVPESEQRIGLRLREDMRDRAPVADDLDVGGDAAHLLGRVVVRKGSTNEDVHGGERDQDEDHDRSQRFQHQSQHAKIILLLKDALDRLYAEYNYPDSATDPIQIVRRFTRDDDREIVGFIAASLAFGRVASVLQSIERVLAVAGPSPAEYVREFDPKREAKALSPIVHRWINGRDIVALLWLMRQMIDRSGSIEGFFVYGGAWLPSDTLVDVGPMIDSFSSRAMSMDVRSKGVSYFFPRPSAGSACKRMNLFLRWMVRRDQLDLGIWTRVSPAKLVVPLDTHVIRVGRLLKLTRYASPGWRMAADITRSLRELDPDDPVKYDFALCHVSMQCADDRALRKRLPSPKPSARR